MHEPRRLPPPARLKTLFRVSGLCSISQGVSAETPRQYCCSTDPDNGGGPPSASSGRASSGRAVPSALLSRRGPRLGSRPGGRSRDPDPNISVANKNPGSLTGSQRPQAQGGSQVRRGNRAAASSSATRIIGLERMVEILQVLL